MTYGVWVHAYGSLRGKEFQFGLWFSSTDTIDSVKAVAKKIFTLELADMRCWHYCRAIDDFVTAPSNMKMSSILEIPNGVEAYVYIGDSRSAMRRAKGAGKGGAKGA